MLLSHSAQVQLQPEVSFVGSVGTGEVYEERKGRGENLAGVGRGTSCPEQCLIGGSEKEECRLPAGGSLGVLSLYRKDQVLCKGLGTIQVRIKMEVRASTFVLRRSRTFPYNMKRGTRCRK